LLTAKPRLYVANVDEASLPDGGPLANIVHNRAAAENTRALVVCAKLEEELIDWPADEADEYRSEFGLETSGLERLIRAGYQLLHLITFFTATGTKVVRAWTLQRGQTAYDAAGKVHTDMQQGFIRAEVISYKHLAQEGDLSKAREHGLIRLEGREYPVEDGDIIHIRFSPRG
jgi:ribosome-binding ATPase YchF (GTP1/OBG family)